MEWKKIKTILITKRSKYFLWLFANLGGLLVSYIAIFTNWLIHYNIFNEFPSYEVYLITGTISLSVTGVSYLRLRDDYPNITLTPLLSFSWPFLITLVYGLLISLGANKPMAPNYFIWIISTLLFIGLISWSSIIWLHEQGLRDELEKEPQKPNEPENLRQKASTLPKLGGN